MKVSLSKPKTVTLDRLTHRYYVDGVLFQGPSISEIVKPYGKDYSSLDPYYALRGTAVHEGCRLLNEQRLDWGTVDEAIKGYLLSYEAIRKTIRPWKWEIPLVSGKSFAGTYDILCRVDNEFILYDIKTAKVVDRVVELQLGGQELLLFENGPAVVSRGYIQVFEDGSDALIKMMPDCVMDFLAALRLWEWKNKKNRGKNGRS